MLPTRKSAIRFIVSFGIISLLADMTYEGARSITGPYLAILGASGAAVGFVAGIGEFIGYGLRLVSGYISDRTRQYWMITFIGYAINLLAVPALALAGNWPMAAMLILSERLGKAIRVPARDTMLSQATGVVGHGWGFGLHEALDQIGAVAGPLIVASVVYVQTDYRMGFVWLLIPALLALTVLVLAWRQYPNPEVFVPTQPEYKGNGFPRLFWFYLAAVVFIAAGYVDFPIIAYHFEKTQAFSDAWIPLLYATAMGVDALTALLCGRLFDRIGLPVLVVTTVIAAFSAPLVFMGGQVGAVVGMVLWGIGMGAQESILKAEVATLIPSDRRGRAYGIFNAGYGLFWFLGSVALGFLYDLSITGVVLFSIVLQIVAVPILLTMKK